MQYVRPHRRLLLRGFLGLRAHADHQKWRDAVHEAVVRLRWRNTLQGWRQWARQQRVEEASLQRARDVHNRQLLAEAWRQWSWVAHKKVWSSEAGLVGSSHHTHVLL